MTTITQEERFRLYKDIENDPVGTYTRLTNDEWGIGMERYVSFHIQQSVAAYILLGIPTGRFLQTVLCNKLMESFGAADETNRRRMYDICLFLRNYAPSDCKGSYEHMEAWIKRGGLVGFPEGKTDDGDEEITV